MKKIVTQIGSLPFKNVHAAVEYSLKHDIPFLPELPKKGDGMLQYIKNPGKLSCLEEFKQHKFDTVKIQCIGPATLIKAGYDEDDALLRINNHIYAILDGLSAKEIILFLDEPSLGNAEFDFEPLWSPIFETFKKVIPGVHTCNNMDWDKLFRSDIIKIISFDASVFDITGYPLYRNRKRIAWGIEKKEDIKNFQEGDLITPPCGLGSDLHKVARCYRKLEKLNRIAREIITS